MGAGVSASIGLFAEVSPFQTSQCLLGALRECFFSSLGGEGFLGTLEAHWGWFVKL